MAPIGSLIISDKAKIQRVLRIRKILDGGMRQVGYLAVAAIYALDNHIERLVDDQRRTKELRAVLGKLNWVTKVEPIETKILIFSVQPHINESVLMEKLKQKGISISSMGHGKLRIVSHLYYREVIHTYVLETPQKLNF